MSDETSSNSQPERRLRRVFFALWPDDAVRNAIEKAARRVIRLSGGRPTAKRNLHITVAFLGAVDEEQLARAASVPPVEVGPIELDLDVQGFFPTPRVLWIGPQHVPPALTALERSLWDGLEKVGFEREARIYRPHLTLARRARAVTEETASVVHWRVDALTLVESIPMHRNVHYEPLQHWPL